MYTPDTYDELYTLAQVSSISGYSSMTKDELQTALEDEAPHLLEPFQDVSDLEPGDQVRMNHLQSLLTVEDDGIELLRDDEDEPLALFITMRTNRGGRHQLVIPADGREYGKNGEDPHLRRWRAGDREWMNNSDDPVYCLKVTEDEPEESDESEGEEEDG